MIVSFSGIDSAGKTTQIEMLLRYCDENNIRAKRLWGKARGTPGVEFLKSLVRRDRKMSKEEKQEYRAEFFQNMKKKRFLLIMSLLDLLWYFGIYYRIESLFHKVTILDRYVWDTYIEVSPEFPGIPFENWLLWKMVVWLSPKPRHSFLFVIPAEESLRRDIQKNDLTVDALELKQAKIDLYMQLKDEEKWTHVMDGMKSREELHQSVLKLLGI